MSAEPTAGSVVESAGGSAVKPAAAPAGPPRGIADLEALEAVFGALAHQSRRTILLVLLARGGEMTSGEIAGRFDCSWPTTTRHLGILQDAGLVHVALRGRQRVYRLDRDQLRSVAGGWLARFEQAGE